MSFHASCRPSRQPCTNGSFCSSAGSQSSPYWPSTALSPRRIPAATSQDRRRHPGQPQLRHHGPGLEQCGAPALRLPPHRLSPRHRAGQAPGRRRFQVSPRRRPDRLVRPHRRSALRPHRLSDAIQTMGDAGDHSLLPVRHTPLGQRHPLRQPLRQPVEHRHSPPRPRSPAPPRAVETPPRSHRFSMGLQRSPAPTTGSISP